MNANTSIFREQISIAINKKWNRKTMEPVDFSNEQGIHEMKSLQNHKMLNAESPYDVTIERLESRLEKLENLCDDLFCFVNYIADQLPGMIQNILYPEYEMNSTNHLKNGSESHSTNKENLQTNRRADMYEPCPTRREIDIIELLIKGYCAKEIANKLFISETTVITHKKNLKEKFRVKNTVELISKVQHFLRQKNS